MLPDKNPGFGRAGNSMLTLSLMPTFQLLNAYDVSIGCHWINPIFPFPVRYCYCPVSK